ncbi:MAG: NUDIX domain-containing protein [Chloroflexota bacterium]
MLIVAAIIQQGEQLLLVRQQGQEDPVATWAIPGGKVEAGELPTEALAREVHEETGLVVVDPGRLAYVVHGLQAHTGARLTAFVFDVSNWAGQLEPADPDEVILDVRFLPLQDALAVIEDLPWPVMREPLLAYLRHQSIAGSFWLYREDPDGRLGHISQVPTPSNGF